MENNLLMIASVSLSLEGIIFLFLSLVGYEKSWTLPTALVYIILSTLFQIVFRQRKK